MEPRHATSPSRHRPPALPRLRPAHPLPLVHVVCRWGGLGLAPQEPLPGRMAAGPDAAGEPLADGPDLPDLRAVGAFPVARDLGRPLPRPAQLAAAAAAGVRLPGGGAVAALRSDRQRVG